MEGKSKGYQTSSFVADLFDVKEAPLSSASGAFATIFPSPQKVMLLFLNCSVLLKTLSFSNMFRFCRRIPHDLEEKTYIKVLSTEFLEVTLHSAKRMILKLM